MNNIFQIGRRHDALTDSLSQELTASLERDAVLDSAQTVSKISQTEARKSLAFPMEKIIFQLPDHYDEWKILGGESMRKLDRTDVLMDPSGRKIVLVGGGCEYVSAETTMQCEALSIVSIPRHANTIHELITIAAGGHYATGNRSDGGFRGTFSFAPDQAVRSLKFLSTQEYSQQGAPLVAEPKSTRGNKTLAFIVKNKNMNGTMTPAIAVSSIMNSPAIIQFPPSLIDVHDPNYKHLITANGDTLILQLKKTLYKGERGRVRDVTHISVNDILERYLNQVDNPAAFVSRNRDFLRELAAAETQRAAQEEFIRNRKLQRHIPMSKGEYYSEHYAALHEKVIAKLSNLLGVEPFYNYARVRPETRSSLLEK